MRLLVVEDERSLREDIAKKLRLSGYEVDACEDGEEALDILASEQYDLILLDLNLPKVDGMTVLRTLRESDLETRVLILSARSAAPPTRWMALTQVPTTISPSPFTLRSLRHACAV